MKRGLTIISLMVLGGGMSGCADSTSWKEEVRLQDGGSVVVERTVVRKGRHELGQEPPIGEESLSFEHPVTHERIRWKNEYGDAVGMSNFVLLMLDIDQSAAYAVGEPRGCLSYNKWGRPNPPYVVFKYQEGDWKRIALHTLPQRFNTPNLIVFSPDKEAKKVGLGLVSAESVSRINNESLADAPGVDVSRYKTILREPMKPGAAGVDCEDSGSPRYTSPRGWEHPYVPRYNTIDIPPSSDAPDTGKGTN